MGKEGITRRNLLRFTGLTAVALALGSCANSRIRLEDTFEATFSETNQNEFPIEMTLVNLYGNSYFIHENNLPISNSLPFALVPYNKTNVVMVGDKRKSRPKNLETDVYVPVPVVVRDKYGQMKHAKQLTFSTEDVVLGEQTINGIKINTSIFARKPKNRKEGYSLKLTEEDIEHSIKMTNILDQNYFYPHSKISGSDELNFVLMPYNRKHTQRIIDLDTGKITVRDNRGIYRPANLRAIKELAKDYPAIYGFAVPKTENESLSSGTANPEA